VPRFLRKIKMARWRDVALCRQWLAEGEIPADPVCDLDTQDNSMSVYMADSGLRTIEELAAAYTAMRDSLQPFDYVIFESEDLDQVGIEVAGVQGTTPDSESNKLHRDLVRISAQKLVALTSRILQRNEAEICDRVNRKVVACHIMKGVQEGWLDLTKVNPKVLESAKKDTKPQT
jgi:hypothetical protein